ncbi:MAG: ribosomal subunit interface protein [Candidatus Taylorbacteria bacterium RIFCSPHIGHO2_02_FULL_46_13]|uniref:Ribosomal subunit interface protein n=1 Tax=Candidatus Taylorbacteria bacterium RIFCSPHIGHO2_02_FULL_46_13 TaxID=1802312 RepID=A0A1G2MTM6_9BACT|nr:MAG: ribosomal subunit interface protein [Candidatus Taylorbacteria bacterium RIFCSPHIGHO2_02_FULL_46_13]
MRITIKTTNITLTPEISDYLGKRLESLEKLTTRDNEVAIADVEIGRTSTHHHTGDIYRAEINIHIGHKSFRAVKETGDLLTSIDAAKDQMMEELRSDKDRRLSLLRRGSQHVKAIIKGFPWWRRRR